MRSPRLAELLIILYQYGELNASSWIRLSGQDVANAYRRIKKALNWGLINREEVDFIMRGGGYITTMALYSLTECGKRAVEEYLRQASKRVQS